MVGRTERLPEVGLLEHLPILQSVPIEVLTASIQGFCGVVLDPALDKQIFLLLPFGREALSLGKIRVLANTARIVDDNRVLVGHLMSYEKVLPKNSQVLWLPVTQAWGDNLDLVGELAVQFQVIQIKGGKHVGRGVVPNGTLNGESAENDGGYDDGADKIDLALIVAALNHPEIFLDATCRGLQLVLAHLTQILPEEIPNHRSNTEEPIYHPIHNVVSELYGEGVPRVLYQLHEMNVNSYHNQGYRLETIKPFLAEWRNKYGIYVTHVSADGIVELMVRVDNRGRITALIKQFHIEKMGGIDGQKMQELNRWLILNSFLL